MTCFDVNNDELPSMVLNEIGRLADVEVDKSSLSDIETHSHPSCIEIKSENHSSSEINLESVASNLTIFLLEIKIKTTKMKQSKIMTV